MLTSLIRKAKCDYLINTLEEGAGNSKKTWSVVNDLLGRKRSSNSNLFVHQGRNLTDSLDIVEEFNNYFSNVAEILAQPIEDPRISYERYLPEPVHFSFYLRSTSCAEINTIITSMKKKSSGHDDVSISIIKECKEVVTPF